MSGIAQERRRGDRRALAVALGLVLALLGVEIAGGIISGSLALLADAAHMLADAGSLGLALFAVLLAAHPPTADRTFGFRRAEILAALANGVALVALAIWIVVEAVRRIGDPPDVAGGWVLGVGLAGLAVNVAAFALLHRRGSHSLNVRAAARHVLADLLGSVGVIVAAVVLVTTGWDPIDPLVSLAIAALVVVSAWAILREATEILLEATPAGMSAGEVGGAMAAQPGVVEVHDLHIWTITSGFPAVSAHVLVEQGADCHAIRLDLDRMLTERFGLDHSTLQVEHAPGLVKLNR